MRSKRTLLSQVQTLTKVYESDSTYGPDELEASLEATLTTLSTRLDLVYNLYREENDWKTLIHVETIWVQ